jgi:hypothetical protein
MLLATDLLRLSEDYLAFHIAKAGWQASNLGRQNQLLTG